MHFTEPSILHTPFYPLTFWRLFGSFWFVVKLENRMKKILFLTLFLASCAGNNSFLSTKQVESERSRVINYFDTLRANGQPFQSEFYNSSESFALSVPKADDGVKLIYDSIRTIRYTDSADSHGRAFFKGLATEFGISFAHALAGRK